MRPTVFITFLILFISTATQARIDFDLPIQHFTLDNGLRVYVVEDHSTPAFSMRTVLDIGARDEDAGHTGFAHLFEHMMFKGSENVADGEFSDLIETAGGQSNASTSWDRTDYWQDLPSHYLDRILWLEADRFKALAVTDANFINQRDAVKEEMARYYNRPYADVFQSYLKKAFEGTAYGHSVFGNYADLENSGPDYAREFYARYYVASNMVMTIVGDVDFDEVKAKVTQYFGDMPKLERPPATVIGTPKNKTFREAVNSPLASLRMLIVGWHTPPETHDDHYAMDLLSSILFSGDSARMRLSLKDEQGLALGVNDLDLSMRGLGLKGATVTPANDVSFQQAYDAVLAEIHKVHEHGVTKTELEKARNQMLVGSLQSLATNRGRATSIGNGALYYNNPKRIITDLDKYDAVTTADIQRVAKQYFNDNTLVYEISPGGKKDAIARTLTGGAKSKSAAVEMETKQYPEPPPGSEPRPVNFPDVKTITLSNGLPVHVVENHEIPLVTAWLVVNAGSIYADILPSMTATMLLEGTTTRSKAELANAMETLGGELSIETGTHTGGISTEVLSRDLHRALPLLADAARNPAFPQAALDRLKKEAKASVKADKADASSLANTLFKLKAYPANHPYARDFATDAEIDAINVADLKAFHQGLFRPDNSYLVLAGNIDHKQAQQVAEAAFGDWQNPARPRMQLPPLNVPADHRIDNSTIHIVDRAKSSQAYIVMGGLGPARNHSDYLALERTTAIMGNGSTGRLYKDLREKQGLAYAIGSYMSPARAQGTLRAITGTRINNVGTMLKGLQGHIDHMRAEGPSAQELQDEIRQTIGRFPLQIQTAQQIAYRINMVQAYDLPWDYYKHYRDDIRALNRDSMQAAAQRYWPEQPLIVLVGPKDEVAAQVREHFPRGQHPTLRRRPQAIGLSLWMPCKLISNPALIVAKRWSY